MVLKIAHISTVHLLATCQFCISNHFSVLCTSNYLVKMKYQAYVLYTGESDFPFLFHLTLSFVQATACFAVFIGHCSHTCIRQQSLKPYRYRISPATLIWERNAEILRSIFLLHYELHLPAFISSHNLPDATALSPVQFECIQF